MNRESLVRTAILGLVCLAPGVDAAPPMEAPAEVGTLDRVEQSPPAALPERRRRAITLDTADDAEPGAATTSRACSPRAICWCFRRIRELRRSQCAYWRRWLRPYLS